MGAYADALTELNTATQPKAGGGSAGGGSVESMLRTKAAEYDIDPDLFVSLAKRESSLRPDARNPNARSTAGGLFQFIGETWNRYGNKRDKFDPEANADAAARMMREHLDMFGGDYNKALAAHHVGAGKAERALTDGTVGDVDVSTQKWLSDIYKGAGRDGAPEIKPSGLTPAPKTDYSRAFEHFSSVPGSTLESQLKAGQKADENKFSVSKEIGAAIDSYQANLWAIPAAMGSEYALQAMQDNKTAAEKAWQESGAPQSFDEMEFGKNFGNYFAHMALQSSPYMVEFMATGFGVGSVAKAALANTAKGIAEKAIAEAAKMGATKAAAQKAGESAAAAYMGKVYTASGIAGSYPSAVGDVLSNQHEQAGKFDLPTAAALGVPYAALNAAGAEGMAVRAAARGLPKSAITKEGAAGFAGRAALTGVEAGVMEGSTETGQEVMNQLGRMAVDPNAKIDDKRALEAYKESFIAGALLGGVPGAAVGGFRKPEEAKQPPAPVANSPLTSAVNTAQHIQKQIEQANTPALGDDHREQIIDMMDQRDSLTQYIGTLQGSLERADPTNERTMELRGRLSDAVMRRDALIKQLDAAKAFYGGDQLANIGPQNDPLILGNEQMGITYQAAKRILENPGSLDPQIRDRMRKDFAILRNNTLPETTRIDAAIGLIGSMDSMAEARANQATGRAMEREWGAFAEQEAASDKEEKAQAIDKSLANSGPKPLPSGEVTDVRSQLLDRVLSSNPENPNRAFDRALRLDGFRDAGFTHYEKTKIAAFLAHRTALQQESAGNPEQSAQQGRYHHLNYMVDAGWQLAGKTQLVSPFGEVYGLKGAGELQFVRNRINQKEGNGSQTVEGGAHGRGAQGDIAAGGAGIDGAVSQGDGNEAAGSSQGADAAAPDGAVSQTYPAGDAGQHNEALGSRSRLTPLDDPRVAQHAAELRAMAPDAGWAEVGGRLIVAPDGTKTRTRWIPRAEWFMSGMLGTPSESAAAVEKAIAGQPMKKREKLHVQGMMDFLGAQNGDAGGSHAEELATLSDIAYENETEDAQDIIDTLGDVDLDAAGAWADEVESMRALGFTKEEINEITRRKQGAFGSVGEEAEGVSSGETQGAIPEGDGNGNGQAEGQEGFSLNQQTNTEAAAEYKRQQEEAGKKDKEPEQPTVTADQGDLLNTQGSLFNSNRDGGKPTFAQFKKSPYQIKVGDTLVHDGIEYTVKNSNELGVVGERPNGEYQSTVRIFERGEELHRARYRALYGEIAKSELPDDKPGMAKRKIFRNGKSGVREVHEVDAQDVAISELPDHQFFVFKDEESGAYSLTEASTGFRVGAGETAESAVADFESKLEKVGAETVAKHVATSPKIPGAEGAKPTAPNTQPQGQGGTPATAQQAGSAAASPAGGEFDVSKRTEPQLTYLAEKGQPGWKEAAIAELQKRGVQVSTPQQAKTDTLGEDKPVKRNALGLPEGYTFATGKDSREKVSASALQHGDVIHVDGRIIGVDKVTPRGDGTVDLLLDSVGGKSTYNVSADRQIERRKIVKLEQPAQVADVTPTNEGDTKQGAENKEPNLEAAKALIQEAKDTHGDKRKEAIVRKKARELAQKTPLSDEKTVLALDMVSTRLGMGDGGTKALEFLPSVDGEQNKPALQAAYINIHGMDVMQEVAAIKSLDDLYADDAELQDALSHLGDVLGDVFGAKLNITGKQYGASDLLPAMSKVIELLIKKGFKSFRESVGAATNAMRGNANTKGFVDQITPRQWKAAYNSVAEFHEGTDSEEDVAKYSAEQIQKIIALPEKIKEAEQATNHDATPGQKEAGNYAKGKFAWHGLNIAVETAKGKDRTDKETNGDKWRVKMPATYGYVLGSEGADGDHVDVFMGDKPESQRVYVINQTKPGSTEFDEHKVMLGYDSEGAAMVDYLLSFSDTFGASVLGSVSGPYAIDDFKHMLESNRFSRAKPISDRLAYVNPRVEEKPVEQQPPGVKTNGTKEKAAAERLAQLLDKMDQVRMDRNTPEGSAKGIIRSAIEELRKERSVGNIPGLLDTAAQRLFRQYSAFSDVVSEVVESLRVVDKYAETVAKVKAKQEERAIPTLDKITVTRSAQLDGKAVEYDQQANEALQEIDGKMDLAKRLLECLAS